MDQADFERLLAGSQGARRLTLYEVRQCGLPALFLDYGEVLLYRDEQLFSMRDVVGLRDESPPYPLPVQILESGLGIECGWRHLAECTCRFCLRRVSVEERQKAA